MTDDLFHLDHRIVNAIVEQRSPNINHLARHARGRLPWSVRRAHLDTMLSAGVQIVPGSDAGIPHTPITCTRSRCPLTPISASRPPRSSTWPPTGDAEAVQACCGTAAEAEGACCGSEAKEKAVAAGATCC
ncbi:hypothetical protein ACIBQ0_09690 [Nocardia nova]|uniref:hypothetical protein n=1 Tax=Nocardia nova TaxID=37330 RepID=UPI0037AE3574